MFYMAPRCMGEQENSVSVVCVCWTVIIAVLSGFVADLLIRIFFRNTVVIDYIEIPYFYY